VFLSNSVGPFRLTELSSSAQHILEFCHSTEHCPPISFLFRDTSFKFSFQLQGYKSIDLCEATIEETASNLILKILSSFNLDSKALKKGNKCLSKVCRNEK